MKKQIAIILSALLIASLLAACAGGEAAPSKVMTEYDSKNGYTVSYPEEYEPSALAHDVDFVIMDSVSGSSVTIQTKRKVGEITEESFIEDMASDGMEIKVESFATELIGEKEVIVVSYTYNENEITEIIYFSGKKAYFATYTELPGAHSDFRNDMLGVIRSLTF